MTPLQNKRILLGVTGSIACYKAADLASKLRQAGAEVDVILTAAATQFVTPLTFQSVTGRRAYVDADLWGSEGHVLHISLAQEADLLVIAPATANTLAKLAYGLADNLLTLAAVAGVGRGPTLEFGKAELQAPLLVAPAMDGGMYHHAATQENIETLRKRGAAIVGPEEGHLASGLRMVGRMTEPAELVGHIRHLLAQGGPLAGKKVVVSAGGTQEPIDPVRFIANRSSGKQGYALAQAALDLGAEVTLISGPSALAAPVGAGRVDVRTADEMLAAALEYAKDADALVMAAAVADFRPEQAAEHKIKKDGEPPVVPLAHTADILKEVAEQKKKGGGPKVTVGFAAESRDLVENAAKKLKSKGLDFIVANDVSAADAGFEVDTNRVTLLFADGSKEELPLMGKDEVAAAVMGRVAELLG